MAASPRNRRELVGRLLSASDPSIRWRTRVRVLGEGRSDRSVRRLEEQIRKSRTVRRLLAHRAARFREGAARSLYHYWQGLHWALASLADIGYPPEDATLHPILDRALTFWTQPRYQRLVEEDGTGDRNATQGVRVIAGRPRRCASVQGNALLYATRLGGRDDRVRLLAGMIERWQWEDGGWNCDRRPEARVSSFMETLLPMRGLAAYAAAARSSRARSASRRAAELFLCRRMYRRRSDGSVMRPDFVRLHYPVYWHYDVLAGLKGIAEAGRLADPRTSDALDWLESRELPRGGWPADRQFFHVARGFEGSAEYVDWGDGDPQRANPWVTTDALGVLAAAGRLAL
jgi:hypothetical protein